MKQSLLKSMLDKGGKEWDELLPYVAMGYRMTTKKSLGFPPYFLLYGREPIFHARHQDLVEGVFNPKVGAAEMQTFLDERGQMFHRVMPLAFRNLAIAQQRQIDRYRLVRGKGWDRPKNSFSPGDFVLIKQQRQHTLDVPTRPHILRVVVVKPFGSSSFRGRMLSCGRSRQRM